jgi:hypothetical protein
MFVLLSNRILNKYLKIYIFFIFCLYIYKCYGQVYYRIPKYMVYDRIEFFLRNNIIDNCFGYREDKNNLLLKCWRHNRLVDVKINIHDNSIKNTLLSAVSYSI